MPGLNVGGLKRVGIGAALLVFGTVGGMVGGYKACEHRYAPKIENLDKIADTANDGSPNGSQITDYYVDKGIIDSMNLTVYLEGKTVELKQLPVDKARTLNHKYKSAGIDTKLTSNFGQEDYIFNRHGIKF